MCLDFLFPLPLCVVEPRANTAGSRVPRFSNLTFRRRSLHFFPRTFFSRDEPREERKKRATIAKPRGHRPGSVATRRRCRLLGAFPYLARSARPRDDSHYSSPGLSSSSSDSTSLVLSFLSLPCLLCFFIVGLFRPCSQWPLAKQVSVCWFFCSAHHFYFARRVSSVLIRPRMCFCESFRKVVRK